jgi:glyoxylase-like metal-dependent hydrolase (beta-lactamase superfamily II)
MIHPLAQPSRRTALKMLAVGAACALPGGLLVRPASARDAKAAHAFKLGAFDVTVISDGSFTLPITFALPSTPKDEVEALYKAHGEAASGPPGQVNVVVVKTPDATVMVDTGGGTDFMPGVGLLADNLERAGIAADSITHVVFTHAHGDHLWGVIDPLDGGTRFGKARHLMNGTEHDYWLQAGIETKVPEAIRGIALGTARHLKTLGERVERVKAGGEVVPGIALVDTAGHTPGHVSVLVKSGSEQLLIGGDVITNPVVSFARPDWPWGPDMDRAQGAAARKRTLDMLATDRIALLGYHLPWPGLARVERKDAAYRYVAG